MADVADVPAVAQGRRPEGRDIPGDGSLCPPPPPSRRIDNDSRERRDDPHDSSNRSPPIPPPPPLGPSRVDREREYRRRSSSSPPYYPHRDRRRSPPHRPPPPEDFRRARREDGGYDPRRDSPREGYGLCDKRYGYGYSGVYDRGGPGSRGGYMNRPSAWPDSEHGGYSDSPEVIQRGGLMSYKQFIQELEDDISPAEAERRYEEYRLEYISTQKRAYFEAHKEEQWNIMKFVAERQISSN